MLLQFSGLVLNVPTLFVASLVTTSLGILVLARLPRPTHASQQVAREDYPLPRVRD